MDSPAHTDTKDRSLSCGHRGGITFLRLLSGTTACNVPDKCNSIVL